MHDRLRGKAIIVVGSGSGIGAATAQRLAFEGVRVCLADINEAAAANVASEISRQGGEAFSICIDLADESSVNDAVEAGLQRQRRLNDAMNRTVARSS